VIQESQNIGANQSTITVNKYVKGNNGNSWYGTACTDAFSGDISDTITYNPAQSGSGGPMRNTEVLYHTEEFTITHNADGSKQVSITTTFTNGGNSYAPNTNTKTFTLTLDTIPRASTIALSASSVNISSTSGSITWTATSKANYYHTLTWSLGSTTQTISALNHLNNTTQTGTLSYTTLLNALPSSATGTLTLTLKTYSTSGKTTQIGDTQTVTCAITISIKPVTELLNIFIDSTPINGYAIAGYSVLGSDFTASLPQGATSRTTYFSISSGTMATTTSTSASGTVRSNTLPVNSNDATVTISAYTKDSRGIKGDTVTKSITVYGYTVPNASLSAFRTTASGTRQDSGGAYLYAVFSGSVSKSFGGGNTATVVCKSTGGYSGTLTSGNHYALSTDASATVTLTVTDTVGGKNKIVMQVPTAVFAIDMYDDGAGTVGVGLGGIAPENGIIKPYLPIVDVEQNFAVTTAGTDLNDYTDVGIYYFHSSYTPTNIPVGVNGWLMVMKSPVHNTIKQIWWRQGTNDTNSFQTYVRQFNGTAWSSWFRYITSGEDIYADAVVVEELNPTTGTTYYLPFLTGVSGNRIPYANNGLKYLTLEGTADDLGYSGLRIGNTTNSGTAGNKWGFIDLYPETGAYYARIKATGTLTASRSYTLPNSSGTILIQNAANYTSLWTGTLTASNATATFTYSNYSAYCIVGKPGSDSAFQSVIVPRGLITTSNVLWQIGSGSVYTSFNLKYSSTTVTLTKSNSAGSITAVYGIR